MAAGIGCKWAGVFGGVEFYALMVRSLTPAYRSLKTLWR